MEYAETRDIAVIALTRIEAHEKICAERWRTTIKLLWGALGSIGLLLLTKLIDYYMAMHTAVHS